MAEAKTNEEKLKQLEKEEVKLQAELAALRKERDQHRAAFVKELVAEAGALAGELFEDLFRGAWAQKLQKLRDLSGEILRLDPQSHSKLTGVDMYGLGENDGVRFYGKFCFVPLTNNKAFTDILSRCEKHPENPYLSKAK
jgi:hypothetical protein